jgi:phosphohistidine phosphatase
MPLMGSRLKERGIKPDVVVSSTAKRARNTCAMIMREIGFPESSVELEEELYDFGMPAPLSVIRRQVSGNSLMIFGHNPAFTSLANYLANLDIDNVPTAGVVGIEFDITDWSQVERGLGRLLFFDFPKKKH